MPFTKKLGSELLKTARDVVKSAFSNKNPELKDATKKRFSISPGIFVNIYLHDELRGSFGYPPNCFTLSDSIKRSARGAAFMDPRFGPLTKEEFNKASFEIFLIEKLVLLKTKPSEYFKKINPRKHGLYIEYGPFRSMQLPLFAIKRKFASKDYLEKTIEKSGLAPEMWTSPNLKVYVFTVQRFAE